MIQHLVLSGGGPAGLSSYGAARYLSSVNFWNINNIKSMYGTSVGSLISVILSLNYNFEWLDDFFVKRPWYKVFNLEPELLLNIYSSKGIFNENFIKTAIEPLFSAKGLSINITLKEFYHFNGIDIHIFATEINGEKLEQIDLSHKTFPDLTIVKAIAMSSAFPIIFSPVCYNERCYVDGGLLNNYPIHECIKNNNCNIDEVLCFKNNWKSFNNIISDESNLLQYLNVLLKKIKKQIDLEKKPIIVKNTVCCSLEGLGGYDKWLNILEDIEMRKEFINRGDKSAKLFFSNITTTE